MRLGGLDWLVMSRKLQLCASPCLDQMLHQIQWSQHLPPMCSAVTQPSCPAGHHVSQSPHVGPAEAPQLVCLFVCLSVRLSVCLSICLSVCFMPRQGLANSLTLAPTLYVSRFLPAVGLCMLQRNSSCGFARAPAGQSLQQQT